MKLKLHAERKLGWMTPEQRRAATSVWCLCGLHVPPSRIAAFEEGVTCGKCKASIAWSREHEKNYAGYGVPDA